jgi:hypothetical protein
MATTATTEILNSGAKMFYRSGKGNRAHSSYYCIASRRSIWWGEVQAMTPEEARTQGWTGCGHCCTAEDHALLVAAEQAPAKEMCPNNGVTKSGRIYSTCRDCGKEGKVNRGTGRLRAHAPLAK